MLRPTIIFTVIISTIGGLQLFTEPYLFEPLARRHRRLGPPVPDGRHVPLREGLRGSQFKFGYASAIAWCLFLLIAVISRDQLPRSCAGSGRRCSPMAAIAHAQTRTSRRYVARRFRRAGPLTYIFLLVIVLLSLFPLYWSLVVASHDNPPVAPTRRCSRRATSSGTTSRESSTPARSTSTSGPRC